jgi:hypothetical protein
MAQDLVLMKDRLSRAEIEQLLRHPDRLTSDGVRHRHLPELASSSRIDDLPFSSRVRNWIRRQGIKDLHDLSGFTVGELLKSKHFGRKSLGNLLSSVLSIIVNDNAAELTNREPSISVLVTAAAERLRIQPYSHLVRCNDPRFRLEIGPLLFTANASSDGPPLGTSASLHVLAHRIVSRTRDGSPPDFILEAIRKVRYRIARARRLNLEKELEEIVRTSATGRNVKIVLSLLGWSGAGVKTLQTVGDEFDMTRERVRQITTKFTKKAERVRPFAPTLRRAINLVTKRLPITTDEIEAELRRIGLTHSIFRIDGIGSAGKLFGVPIPFDIEKHQGVRTVVRHEDAGLTKSIIQLARRVVSHAGVGKVADLCDRLSEQTGTTIEGALTERVLGSLDSLRWLDEEHEWFFLDDVARNHLRTIVTKVLSVAPHIHMSEMRAAIASDYRGVGFAPPKPVVLEFCKTTCNCDVDGESITARHVISPNEVLAPMEQVAYAVLRDHGPLLHRSDFERKCIEAGMNASTFANYVGRLPILARYGSGVYGLRGAPIKPGDVERVVPQVVTRLRDHGWTAEAKPWLAVELAPAAMSTGIISVPSAISRFVQGKHLLLTEDGTGVGTLVISKYAGWGLGPLFRRRGGEPGDVLALTFDLQRHEARARFGTREDVLADLNEAEPPLAQASEISDADMLYVNKLGPTTS